MSELKEHPITNPQDPEVTKIINMFQPAKDAVVPTVSGEASDFVTPIHPSITIAPNAEQSAQEVGGIFQGPEHNPTDTNPGLLTVVPVSQEGIPQKPIPLLEHIARKTALSLGHFAKDARMEMHDNLVRDSLWSDDKSTTSGSGGLYTREVPELTSIQAKRDEEKRKLEAEENKQSSNNVIPFPTNTNEERKAA